MNLNILPTPVMIAISGEWIRNPVLVRELLKHALGASIWKEIEAAYTLALERSRERMSTKARVAELIKLGVRFDGIHDDRARVLYHLLLILADATRDPALAAFLREVHALMFPHALRIVSMSYLAEAGEAAELEARVTPELLAQLESVRVADQSLADIYREWVEAGKALGHHTQERARLEASMGIQGTIAPRTHTRLVRGRWIRSVRLLLDAIELMDLPEEVLEHLLAPLERGIQTATARRASGNPDVDDIDDDIDDDINDDVEPAPALPEAVLEASASEPGAEIVADAPAVADGAAAPDALLATAVDSSAASDDSDLMA